MKKGKYTLKAITIHTSERTPISMRTLYERETYDDDGHLLNKKEEFSAEYIFREVAKEELMQLRLRGKPGMVYKVNGRFYYVQIPGNLNVTKLNGDIGKIHLCGKDCTKVCKNCDKTRDLTVAFQKRIGRKLPYAVFESWRIEKYDHILEGVEAFNMSQSNDALMVYECQNYEASAPREKRTVARSEQKIALACLYWDDFDGDLRAMRKRIEASRAS